jgi:xanthine/CO dehydrogenase XdhC/CoxF family maturation factor
MQWDIVQGSGQAVSALLEEMQSEHELFASANTLQMVEAHLLVMAQTLVHLSPLLRQRLVQLDWHGWARLQQVLEQDVQPRREEVWYGIHALVPTTLELMAQLRRRQPVWFEIGY